MVLDLLDLLASAGDVLDVADAADATTGFADIVDSTTAAAEATEFVPIEGAPTPEEIINGSSMAAAGSITGVSAASLPASTSHTLSFVNSVMADVAAEQEAIMQMSDAELDAYIAETEQKIRGMDLVMQGESFASGVRAEVGESMRELGESRAQSFAMGAMTPFEHGVTLSDSMAPHDLSEFDQYRDGTIGKDGRLYREWADGVYHRVDADGNWL
jgi:hypothetical protein